MIQREFMQAITKRFHTSPTAPLEHKTALLLSNSIYKEKLSELLQKCKYFQFNTHFMSESKKSTNKIAGKSYISQMSDISLYNSLNIYISWNHLLIYQTLIVVTES